MNKTVTGVSACLVNRDQGTKRFLFPVLSPNAAYLIFAPSMGYRRGVCFNPWYFLKRVYDTADKATLLA